MRLIKILSITAITAIMAISCSDISALEDRLKSLEARVKAIENIIPALNANIEALQVIAGGTTIYSVEQVDGRYKITLSNGSTLYLTQGSVGTANPPLMSIDAEGYWMVDYQDGYGATYILCDGNKVKAIGADGITPQFGVDENGFWTVSYDNGNTWEQVKDTSGKPVSALEGTGDYFANVELTDETFILTLKNGEVINVPVISGFLFTINAPKAIEIFQPGESKAYVITSKGVAYASIVAYPDGFEVTLTEERLYVKASSQTKATADSRIDIAVLAISESGYAAMGKVRVMLEGSDVPTIPEDPEQPVEPEDPPVDPEQPSDPVIPVEGSNYHAWINGNDIEVGGLILNKTMFEGMTPVLVTSADTKIEGNGVYFIESGITASIDLTGKNAGNIVIIGNDPEKRSKVTTASQLRIAFTEGTDYAVMANVEIDFTNAGNYPLNLTNNGAGVFEYVIFDNCQIIPYAENANFHYNGVAGKEIDKFIISDSEFITPAGQSTYKLIAASKGQNYSHITIDNSIFYTRSASAVKFNIWEGWSKDTESVLDKLTIRQSSFINLQINNGFIRVGDMNEIDIQNNIFYATDSSISSWQYVLRAESNGPKTGTGKNNFAYIDGNDKQSYKMFYSDDHMNAIGAEQFKKSPALFDASQEAVFDIEKGIFTPSKNYRQHGAQR